MCSTMYAGSLVSLKRRLPAFMSSLVCWLSNFFNKSKMGTCTSNLLLHDKQSNCCQQKSTSDAGKLLTTVRMRPQTAALGTRILWCHVAYNESALQLNVNAGDVASCILSSEITADLDAVHITSSEHEWWATLYIVHAWWFNVLLNFWQNAERTHYDTTLARTNYFVVRWTSCVCGPLLSNRKITIYSKLYIGYCVTYNITLCIPHNIF